MIQWKSPSYKHYISGFFSAQLSHPPSTGAASRTTPLIYHNFQKGAGFVDITNQPDPLQALFAQYWPLHPFQACFYAEDLQLLFVRYVFGFRQPVLPNGVQPVRSAAL